ncbi:MAG: polysaccharide biosynthesis C-terminal domain-containing protein, partial [Candidatus Omnitrophica bacterium]|nr:polysaccharide biosynthesis C-terminal domain-containing protein [Candidatus Omnitrophota bacterium]
GYYTFGATISFMLFLFPKGLADVFEPKLHFHHALEKPGHSIRKNFLGPVYVLAWLMPVFLLVGHSLLPLVLKLFLPDYLPGLLVMRVLIWTSYFVGLIAMTKSSLVALNRQLYTVPAIIAAILINAGMSLWMVGNGYGVAGVAVGSTTALCIVSLWLVWLIIGELDQSKWVSFQCFLKIYLPFAILGLPCLTWAWLTEMPSSSPAAWLYSFPIAGIAIYFSAGFYFLMKWFIKSNLKKDAMESVEVIP